MRAQLISTTCLFLIGAGVGWLVGLSVSPVVGVILASVMGTVGTLVAALSGLHVEGEAPRYHVSPVPIAILLAGIIIGSLVGLRARNANWLGWTPQQETAYWRAAGLDMSQNEILRRLFEREHPVASGTASPPAPGRGTYLYGATVDECAQLQAASDVDLPALFRQLGDERLHNLPSMIPDTAALARYVKEILCAAPD